MNIKDNIKKIFEKIDNACLRASRKKDDITVVAVTKTVDINIAKLLLNEGIKNLGENRVQEFLHKYEVIKDNADWHLIGHLQTNKVKFIIGKIKLIHSADSFELIKKLNEKSMQADKITNILLQVNTSGEESKYGIRKEDELFQIIEDSIEFKNIKLNGLMTMAPFTDDKKIIRDTFQKTFKLHEKIKLKFNSLDFNLLSFGMSNDYEIAVEEGANILRIGTAFFE